MTSTTKRGFHLPWGGDDRAPTAATATGPGTSGDQSAEGPRSGGPARATVRRAAIEDLGRGPFSLVPTAEAEADADAGPGDDQLVDNGTVTRRLPDRVALGADALADDAESLNAAPPASDSSPTPAAAAGDSSAWPDVDRAGSPTHLASDVTAPPARPRLVVSGDGPEAARSSRRDNPLVIGLVKAMRDAARATRIETTARMREGATARMEEIRVTGATDAVGLRKRADDDLAGIREWSKAEMARIREDTEQRIAGRRAQLAREAQTQTTEIERTVDAVKAAAEAFEADMERFFEILLAEEDPARLATLAERVPDAPAFDEITVAPGRAGRAARSGAAPRTAGSRKAAGHGTDQAEDDSDAVGEPAPGASAADLADEPASGRLEPDAAAAAEAEAIADLEPSTSDDAAWTDGSLAAVLATAPRIDSPDDLSPEEIAGLLGVDPDATADDADQPEPEPEPEPAATAATDPEPEPEPEPEAIVEVTRVVVTGMVSVAGISAFKAAIARLSGVSGVSVTSGEDDDIVFNVVHSSTTDLRRSIPTIPGFDARMTVDEGTAVAFTVTEPGAA